jgi:hypothetical protein
MQHVQRPSRLCMPGQTLFHVGQVEAHMPPFSCLEFGVGQLDTTLEIRRMLIDEAISELLKIRIRSRSDRTGKSNIPSLMFSTKTISSHLLTQCHCLKLWQLSLCSQSRESVSRLRCSTGAIDEVTSVKCRRSTAKGTSSTKH